MKCHDVRDWLCRDLDGAAEPSAEAAAHLERCGACAREAERLQAIAAAARGVLPPADAPDDFAERVLTAVGPLGDRALARSARPRLSRWWPVLLVAVLLPLLATWPRAPAGDELPLEAFATSSAGGLELTALARSLVHETEPLTMRAGSLLVEAAGPAVVHTDLADVRLRAGAVCILRLLPEKETEKMNFAAMKRFVPATLLVTVLGGGADVVNAQGAEELHERETARVRRGEAPLKQELDEARREIRRVRVLMESLHEVTLHLQAKVDHIQKAAAAVEESRRRIAVDRTEAAELARRAEKAAEAKQGGLEGLLERAARGDRAAMKKLAAIHHRIQDVLHEAPAPVRKKLERREAERPRSDRVDALRAHIAHLEEAIERLHGEAGMESAIEELAAGIDRAKKELAELIHRRK